MGKPISEYNMVASQLPACRLVFAPHGGPKTICIYIYIYRLETTMIFVRGLPSITQTIYRLWLLQTFKGKMILERIIFSQFVFQISFFCFFLDAAVFLFLFFAQLTVFASFKRPKNFEFAPVAPFASTVHTPVLLDFGGFWRFFLFILRMKRKIMERIQKNIDY